MSTQTTPTESNADDVLEDLTILDNHRGTDNLFYELADHPPLSLAVNGSPGTDAPISLVVRSDPARPPSK